MKKIIEKITDAFLPSCAICLFVAFATLCSLAVSVGIDGIFGTNILYYCRVQFSIICLSCGLGGIFWVLEMIFGDS